MVTTSKNKAATNDETSHASDNGSDKGSAAEAPATSRIPSPAEDASVDTEKATIYIGMDLGTSRTAVAGSNGVRESLPSLIGYPKDVVAQKLLKREVLYGKEVQQHRLSLKTFRPLEHGVIKGSDDGKPTDDQKANQLAAQQLVKYAISLVKPPPDALVYCVIGAPAEASIKNRTAILESGKDTIDAVMVTSEPFAVAYGMDVLTDALVIDIGAGTTDLCRMHGTMPEEADQVTLDHAGDTIDQVLSDLIKKNHPEVSFSLNMVTQAKEKYATVSDATEPVIVTWPVNGKPTDIDITAEMKEACHSIVPPIVEALGKLVASFDPEFQEILRNNVLLGGGGSQIRGLAEAITIYMGEHLGGGQVRHVEEPVFAGANGALKIAKDMPPEFWEQLS